MRENSEIQDKEELFESKRYNYSFKVYSK